MSNNDKEKSEETILQWILRYLFIPMAVAVTAGLFAIHVINIQIEANALTEEDQAAHVRSVLATLMAMTPDAPEAAATATVTPTATATVPAEATATSTAPPEPLSAVSCGIVPFGWEPYQVRWGDTLYSLSRRSGASIAQIEQANCIDVLKANTTIWLPGFVEARPEPTRVVEERPEPTRVVEEPTAIPIDDEPPIVRINTPETGAFVIAGNFVESADRGYWYASQPLSGTATDPQDGVLPAEAFVWTTDQTVLQDATLGTGAAPTAQLLANGCNTVNHTVRLTATDSAGNVGFDEVTVAVQRTDC